MIVSVVIPCYNCSKTINRAVESVFFQTYKNWELILVNNNSTDDTLKILLDIKDKNSEKSITVLQEYKKGAPAARNKGLFNAKGDWIQFLDADDELSSKKIEKQIYDNINSNADIIYSPFQKIKMLNNGYETKDRDIEFDPWTGLILSKLGITSANLFKKSALLNCNGWDENLTSSQEYDLMFRILKNGGIAIPCNSSLTYVHFQDNSIANSTELSKIIKRLYNFVDLRSRIIAYLDQNQLSNEERQKAYDKIVSRECIMAFRANPTKVFLKFNATKKMSFRTKLKTNWTFFKLKLRLIFNILPE